MENFRKGDFIRLKDLDRWQVNSISGKTINVFEINNIEPKYVEIKNCKEKIPISEIEPIPINGRDDSKIYYDPIIAASIVFTGDSIPISKKDYSYYYDSFKKYSTDSKNYQELVKEQNLNYVHQVQHFLFEKFRDNGLKLDTY